MAEDHMKRGLRGVLVFGFLVIAFVLLAGLHWSKPRILVLHSFDETVRSVVKTNEGINRILAANRQPVSVRWHYLGMNHLPDEAGRRIAALTAERGIEQFAPDIIIAVDDEAQLYVALRYIDDPKIKLVFTAIDQKPKDYGYIGKGNVTGISEVLPLAAISETLLHARNGKAARIAVLTSPTTTGLARLQQIEQFSWAPHTLVSVESLQDFASWQMAVNNVAESADLILVLDHQGVQKQQSNRSLVSGAEITQWLNQHSKPLPLGLSSDYVEQGGVLAIYPSSLEMGELATVYALKWLRAGSRKDLPLIESAHFRIGFRESMVLERQLKLPQIYTEAANLEGLHFP
jgi:ABC-type uncharacterized transport system substrate-binding protein